jgi:hypothetical protein
MTPEQEQEIVALRDRKLTPKQIARKLGLRVSEVSGFIKNRAEQTAIAHVEAGELDPIVECLVNGSCVDRYFPGESPQETEEDEETLEGMALVSVARNSGFNRITVCTYLVDLWCLGVKDTMGPRQIDPGEYSVFKDMVYRGFDDVRQISLEQAQAIVFSAVEYAAKLGFSPHPDFEETKPHLGQWSGEPRIECGRDGKPFYMSGPYDNPLKVIKTLRESVGEGNFDYVTAMG